MSEDLICPDCGGVIGGEPGSGRQICRCFEPRRTVVAAPMPESVPHEPMLASGPDASSPGEKSCRVCGKDLRGHRRLKDSRGYICVKCAEAEEAANDDPNLIPCTECNRRLKIDGMTTYDGIVMCKRCAKELKELHKYKGPPPALVENNRAHERARLQKLLVFAGVLLVIMALAYFGWIGQG